MIAPAAPTAPADPARAALADTTLLAGRVLRRLRRQPEVLVQSLFFPVALLLMLLAVFGDVVSATISGSYAQRLVPLMALEGAAFGAVAAGIGLRADLESGMVARIRSLPITAAALVYGRVAADAVRIGVATVVVVAIGYVVGFRFSGGVLATAGFFVLAVVFGLSFTWFAVWLGLRSSSAEAINALATPVLLACLFLCSAFVPVDGFPGWLQPVVRANPLSCASNALIGLSSGGPVAVPTLQTLAWALGITAVSAPLSLRRWNRLAA